jgi:hypothetical protein
MAGLKDFLMDAGTIVRKDRHLPCCCCVNVDRDGGVVGKYCLQCRHFWLETEEEFKLHNNRLQLTGQNDAPGE